MAAKIFINYRRDDSAGTAGRLYDRLAQAFGRKNLFMDVDHIPAGVDFVDYLSAQVSACDLFLVIIGPNWLTAKDDHGAPRLQNPNDFVATEILAALERGIRVIPVLIDSAKMPSAAVLPELLKPLHRRNAVEVRNSHFGRDAEALVQRIREASAKQSGLLSKWLLLGVGVPAAALLLVGTVAIYSDWFGPSLLSRKDPGNSVDAQLEAAARGRAEEERRRAEDARRRADEDAKRKAEEEAKRRVSQNKQAPQPPATPGKDKDSQQGVPFPQRVVLYEEDPADPAGKRYVGSAIWRTEMLTVTQGQPAELAVRSDVEIPDRRITTTFSMRRNTDRTFAASHTIEITFNLPADFPFGGISNVPGILMKEAEHTRGAPLAGVPVKVATGFFLIGLSATDSEMQRNIDLMKKRGWLDIPLVYSNGRRAILAVEKGVPGDKVFTDAFRVWKQ
jgi:TIR domain